MIWEGDIYAYGILPLAEGIAYSYREADITVWEYVSADGETTGQLEGIGEGEPFYADGEQVLYVAHFYGTPMYSQIWRQTWDGEATLLAQTDPDAEYAVHPLGDGEFLLEHYAYVEWGPVNEYGYRENYALPTRYSLLHSDGTITDVNATGESGSLFAGGDFPVIDSSTARKPVTAELYTLFVKNYGYEGQEPLCSTTHGAWLNIADGVADLALLAAPTPEEQAYLQEKGVEVEMKLYGGDGLVFIGNAANPVQNLTHEQIVAIYRGEIKNWSELGGPDEPIIVYYRDDQSGSQRLFEKMVFKGLELPKYEDLGFWYMDEMSTIVDIVIDDPYAIGYSIMTYLEDVYENENLKVFAVNGVAPSVDSVKDSTYPYHTQGFIVIRSDEPAGSPARRLYDWFGSPVSDEILVANGITPLHGESGIG
jgi:ABC-type phosphate transport system substrate-binding protein